MKTGGVWIKASTRTILLHIFGLTATRRFVSGFLLDRLQRQANARVMSFVTVLTSSTRSTLSRQMSLSARSFQNLPPFFAGGYYGTFAGCMILLTKTTTSIRVGVNA